LPQIIKSALTAILTDFEIKVVSIKYKYKAGKEEIFQTYPARELDKELLKSMTQKRKAEKNAFSTCDARIHLKVSDTRQYTFKYAPVMSCRI